MPFVQTGGAYGNDVSNVGSGALLDVCALDEAGKFFCLYHSLSTPQYPYGVIVTLNGAGELTIGAQSASLDNANWLNYGASAHKVAADKILCIGTDSANIEGRLLSYTGTTVTLIHQLSPAFEPAQGRCAWDYANSRGLLWGPNGGTNNAMAVIVTGSTISYGAGIKLDSGGYTSFGSYDHYISFDPTTSRYLLVWNATRSGTSGIWAMTCQLDGSNNVINATTPVLIHQATTSANGIHIAYHATSGKHVVGYNLDGSAWTALVYVNGATVEVQHIHGIGDDSATHKVTIGVHPVTDDIFYLCSENLIDRFASGRIVGNELRWPGPPGEVDPWPASSIHYTSYTAFAYDATTGWMVLGGTRSSEAQLLPFTWTPTTFQSLPAFTAGGGSGVPVNVDITLPAIGMYQGNVAQLSIDGEFEAVDVVDFFIANEIIPRLSGDLAALEGEAYGGAFIEGELGALEGEWELYNTTTLVIDGELAALQGSASGVVHVVGALYGELGALEGTAYGSASIGGELAALEGLVTGFVTGLGAIAGALAPLEGLVNAENPGQGYIVGELAPLEAFYGALAGEFAALEGSMVIEVTETTSHVAWVMNKAHAGVSRYPDYGFTFVLRWQGQQYLAGPAGIYAFDESEAEPDPIDAKFTLPGSDYGETLEKRVPRVYLQGKIGGQMAVGIAYDEGTELTADIEGQPGVDYWRAKLPRGPKGHHVQVSVANVDGADFELEQLDALMQVNGRKI